MNKPSSLFQGVDHVTTAEAVSVPVATARVRDASVLWLNERWFLAQGAEIADPAIRKSVEHELLETYAHSTDDITPGAGANWHLRADRYGASSATAHGGSGRCGGAGAFQVKGIGVTPLVGDTSDWNHSHGRLWMEEAIREAIWSEVVEQEFPHGGVPTVALIDLGRQRAGPDGRLCEDEALLLRPACLRPAHWERAVLPAALETETLSNSSDVLRVRAVVAYVIENSRTDVDANALPAFLDEMLERIAQQMAHSLAHRVFTGGYSSSNVASDGKLLDYGAFRTTPLWARIQPAAGQPMFGDERLALRNIAESARFTFGKYHPAFRNSLIAPQALARLVDLKFHDALRQAFSSIFGLDDLTPHPLVEAAVDAMLRYFEAQQRVVGSHLIRIDEESGVWIGDKLSRAANTDDLFDADACLETVAEAIDGLEGAGLISSETCWASAARLLKSRPALYREELQERIWDLLALTPRQQRPEVVADLIRQVVSQSRRHWPLLPLEWVVLAQVTSLNSSALLVRRDQSNRRHVWIEGTRSTKGGYFFGTFVDQQTLSNISTVDRGATIGTLLSVETDKSEKITVSLGGANIELPPFDLTYAMPINSNRSDPQRNGMRA